ncbi:hypothetical protein DL546_002377 [Coniochaeta pulveracea]|uniref:Phosphatidic acid phosphatase type 2/haloperoxidase domain-containing protein n=1 Tax=Coniochaeta pulveracea TaxID=177199 RepID=A0A420YFQ4_9PEZI|nr:hypothetical protein DL546_002377 [Coniochaeta pulveracea]
MLPFHRRVTPDQPQQTEPDDSKATAEASSKRRRLWKFVANWFRVSWKDVITMIVLGVAEMLIYRAPLAATRTFPITFTASGDIVYPQYAYPNRGWIISSRMGGLISTWTPIIVFVLAQIRIRSFWDLNNAIMGLSYSLILGTLFQVSIKILIGGFRPYFLVVCQPDISRAATHNTTGLNGVGFHQIMYSADVCTNPDKGAVKNAMTSFPSGHSTAAFASGVFLFLWMNAKLKVWSDYQASFYWLALLFTPLFGAVLQACLLTIDMAHNWYDILVGAIIGTMFAFASYRLVYASIFDWRYNHIPLTRTSKFDYTHEVGPEHMARDVFVRKMGWGGKRRTGRGVFARRKVKEDDDEILESPGKNTTQPRGEGGPTVTAGNPSPSSGNQAMQDPRAESATAEQLV